MKREDAGFKIVFWGRYGQDGTKNIVLAFQASGFQLGFLKLD